MGIRPQCAPFKSRWRFSGDIWTWIFSNTHICSLRCELPKCQYILGILWDYTLFLFRYRHLDQLDHIYTCIQKQNQTNASKVDSEWSGFFDYYHTLINTPRPINKSDADRIARDLIGNTDDTAGLVSIEKKNGTINYQRRSWNLLVTLQTGQWKFSENERYVMNHLNNLGTEQG